MVDAFTRPVEAYSHFQRGKYEVALLDINMPGIDGIDLSRRLRQVDPTIVTCFLTAFDYFELRKNNPDLQADLFFNKPISVSELKKKILKALELHSSREL